MWYDVIYIWYLIWNWPGQRRIGPWCSPGSRWSKEYALRSGFWPPGLSCYWSGHCWTRRCRWTGVWAGSGGRLSSRRWQSMATRGWCRCTPWQGCQKMLLALWSLINIIIPGRPLAFKSDDTLHLTDWYSIAIMSNDQTKWSDPRHVLIVTSNRITGVGTSDVLGWWFKGSELYSPGLM